MARRLLVLLIAVILGIGVVFWSLRPSAVAVERPRVGAIRQTVVTSGQVMPPAEVRVAALVSSTAKEVLVREGESITNGQLLLQLDDEDAQARLAQAEAALLSAKAGRSELVRLSAPSAETALRRADAQLAEARRRLENEQNLFHVGATTREMVEEMRTAEAVSAAQRKAALLQFRAASQGGTQALRAQASVALAEAQVTQARVQLERHQLRSPCDGIVVSRRVEPGDAVAAATPLLMLSATGATRLKVEPDERNLARLAQGQSALASAEAYPDKPFEAEVQFISPQVDPARGTIEVRLLVTAPPPFLRQNMTVSVEITVAEKPNALTIARSSVHAERSEPHVWLLENGRVAKRVVSLGLVGDERVEVTSGLTETSWVITELADTLKEGAKARAVPSPASQSVP